MDIMERYEHKTDAELRQIRAALAGMPGAKINGHHVNIKINGIDEMLRQRSDCASDKPEAPSGHEVSSNWIDPTDDFEYAVALKYVSNRRSAEKRRLTFTLTLSDMRNMMRRKTCYYTGIQLLDNVGPTHPQRRTIDRIDAAAGYTKDNCVACSYAANQIKSYALEGALPYRLTPKQLMAMAEKLTGQKKEPAKKAPNLKPVSNIRAVQS